MDASEGAPQREDKHVPLRRELDSLDDFEHLEHDASPVDPAGKNDARDELGVINKGHDDFTAANVRELSMFDPLQTEVPKMDSNLLEMGDNIVQEESKLDKFMEDLGAFAPPKHEEPPEVHDKDEKTATQTFMEFEREKKDELLERYSDSEPEEEFKQPSKFEDFQQKPEAFKDVEEVIQPPPKDYPEPVREKTPEPVKLPVEKKKGAVIDAEAIFCKMGLDAWFNPERLNPKVESLIYWRDPKKSGPVFGAVLVVLLALTYFSLISVVAYLSLLALTGTISFRIYKNVVQAVQKTGDGHPFKSFLEVDVALPQEKVKEVIEIAVAHANAAVVELRRLFLVEDLVDSIKFGVFLWTLTYLGSWFNGMTLIIIAWVALFSLPKVYETNKTQIDANLEIVRTKLAEITSKVKAAIPIGKKTEEKKEQ